MPQDQNEGLMTSGSRESNTYVEPPVGHRGSDLGLQLKDAGSHRAKGLALALSPFKDGQPIRQADILLDLSASPGSPL